MVLDRGPDLADWGGLGLRDEEHGVGIAHADRQQAVRRAGHGEGELEERTGPGVLDRHGGGDETRRTHQHRRAAAALAGEQQIDRELPGTGLEAQRALCDMAAIIGQLGGAADAIAAHLRL